MDVGVGAKVDVNAYLRLGLKTSARDRVSIGWGAAVAGMIGAADGGDAEWPADGCEGEAPEEAASGTE